MYCVKSVVILLLDFILFRTFYYPHFVKFHMLSTQDNFGKKYSETARTLSCKRIDYLYNSPPYSYI